VTRKIFIPLITLISLILFDQLSKAWVLGGPLPSVCNSGFAFGIGQGILSGLIAAMVLLVLIFWIRSDLAAFTWEVKGVHTSQVKRSWRLLGLSMVIGGGASNIIDRLIHGCVVDFINLGWWPAFNLADAAITVGVAILIFSAIRNFKNPRV